jgi:methylmalonyl-CoA mutase N-terminal domain/subunit
MKDLGATDPDAMKLRFHTQTGGSTLTAQQPLNNVVRVAYQAMAAVLGGTQSLHTNGYDEALSLPTEQAAGLALRTQQILGFESGVTNTPDPLAGSFFVETLTEEIAALATAEIERIEAMGGAVSAIEQGYMQEQIGLSAYRAQKGIEDGSLPVVGVNKFQGGDEVPPPVFKIDSSIQEEQSKQLAALRSNRDTNAVETAISGLDDAAKSGANLLPHILLACESYATLGEIADTLRVVFGEHK